MDTELNNSRVIKSWCMYDWANSVYNLVINTAIFPIYYTAVTSVEGSSDVSFFGFTLSNSVLYSYALSFSYLLSAALLPILSGIADYTGEKKKYLRFFTFLGSIACMSMFFFTGPETLELGILCVVVASLGYSSGLVFYDAYLPEIVSEDRTDRVSARGYSYGYGGSALMLIFSLLLIQKPDWFGLGDSGFATRIVFILVGLWWVAFAQIPFKRLPNNIYNRKPSGKILLNGYRELRSVFVQLKELPNLRMYLIAFFFFNMGVQTIMLLATLFGTKELNLGSAELIPVILIIQFVAIGGSYIFARLSEYKGNVFSLGSMIFIWVGVCIYAYFITAIYQFYIIAVLVGTVMGGIQALSRATYSKLIPRNTEDHTSFFSFFDVAYHLSVVLGTFSYGFVEQVTGSMRNSTIALSIYFIIGFLFLNTVKIRNAKPTAA
ncbi:MAG: MFS transporter [Cyclobacteriaceae bacterium]